jgi:alpha-L-fucosidase 2
VWDLFNNFVQAADVLGVDKDYSDKISAMRDKLVTPQVGKWGQLQEWMTDRDDANDHHRHTSHLFGVYPGTQISTVKTPELAKAAKVSLDARGIASDSDVREWSFAWRTALYARLRDAENAHQMLQQLFSSRNTCPNLFGLHPPMQIDGNFGVTAGIAEMLMQSQIAKAESEKAESGKTIAEIELLPALPSAWPSGKVSGLRARGGYEVGIKWQDGKFASVLVKNVSADGPVTVRCAGKVAKFDLPRGESKSLDAKLN